MLRFRHLSIKHKLVWGTMLASVTAMVLAAGAFLTYELVQLRSSVVRSLSAQADMVGLNSVSAILFQDRRAAEEVLSALRAEPNITWAAIYTSEGEVFATYSRPNSARAAQWPERLSSLAGTQEFREEHLILQRAIVHEGKPLGAVILQVSLEEMAQRTRRYVMIVSGVLLLSCLVAYYVSARMQQVIAGPISQLADTARTISTQRNYAIRAPAGHSDEVGLLTETFNEMLEQIERRNAELQEAHNQLEVRVQARTAELAAANKELEASEEQTRLILERAREAFISIDSQGHIIEWNPQAEATFGWSRAEALGRTLASLIIPERYREAHRLGLERFLATGEGPVLNRRRIEMQALRRDGHEIPVELSISAVPAGTGYHFHGFLQDISERKQNEEAIQALNRDLHRRALELEAANKELEAFTYSVSHDLRAPLRHIDGFSKILVEEHARRLPPQARKHLAHIREGTQQMGALIDDLLNLSRVTRKELTLQVTGLNSLLEEVVQELQRETHGREIDWQIGRLPFVECDPGLIKQVFNNLLSNALKFTRPRPHAVIQVDQQTLDGQAVLFVRDNGVGFSMKYADKLFGVFQRLHRPEDFEGTGVGLATVQRILHKHGGRIWAEANLDQGATFYFTLGSPPSPGGSS